MSNELTDKLIKDFPRLFTHVSDDGERLPCAYLECGDGWFDIIYECSKKICEACKDLSEDDHPKILQIKEKFGGLRYYISSCPEEMCDTVRDAVDFAEKKSYETCETCGEPGTGKKSHGWYYTACEKHTISDQK